MVLHIICSVCMMSFICMLSGLTIWYWITTLCVIPWGRIFFSHSHDSSVACKSLGQVEATWNSPVHFNMSINVILVPFRLSWNWPECLFPDGQLSHYHKSPWTLPKKGGNQQSCQVLTPTNYNNTVTIKAQNSSGSNSGTHTLAVTKTSLTGCKACSTS